jgi:DnaJ family protein A protein 5
MSSSGGSSHTPARCLYEALGVPRDVSADALKKAYYKKALAHHPDKCVGSGRDPDEARARFQEIQHAYAVLSDSRERTFYDEHRDQILGDDGDEGGRLFNFMPFFRPDSFKGHGDDPEGFYAVFGRVFGKIFESEMSEYQGRDPPQFGSSLSPYDEVKAFYNFWGSFSSRLNFSWEVSHALHIFLSISV